MASIYFNKKVILQTQDDICSTIKHLISEKYGISPTNIYLEKNGRRLVWNDTVSGVAHCRLRVLGGKGGFGSMLRAIGAQIEKTTNREACRDLSGRRLRDINEEKRLKAALDKMAELERDSQQRKKRKIEKLHSVPRHDFKDVEYEEARAKLAEKVNNAVEEGLKRTEDIPGSSGKSFKRKHTVPDAGGAKKKKTALWIDDDLLDSDESNASSESNLETVESEAKKNEHNSLLK